MARPNNTPNKLRRAVPALVALIMLSAVSACGITGQRGNGDDNYFSAFHTFSDQLWDYRVPLELRVDTLRDSVSRGGTLMLSLRHTAGYEYRNIWLELEYPVAPDSTARDTFNVVLADRYGRWHGSGAGPSVLITDTLSRDFTLYRGSTLRLRHIMRLDTLPNIEQVGIVFLPND